MFQQRDARWPYRSAQNISIMGTDLSKLPPIYVSPSRELSNVAMVVARDAGLNVEQHGIALLKSAEPPLVLNYDLTPWLAYLAGLAGALTPKIIDGAIAEIGAEMLRRFARMVRAAVKASPRRPSVTVRFGTDDGRRAYHLPAIDLDAAAEAILADVGLATEHPVDRERFWDEGRWIGGNEWHVRQGRRPPFAQGGARLPRAESFAALAEIRAIFGTEIAFSSSGSSMGVPIPPNTPVEIVEQALSILRKHLPTSVSGVQATRSHDLLVVSDALD